MNRAPVKTPAQCAWTADGVFSCGLEIQQSFPAAHSGGGVGIEGFSSQQQQQPKSLPAMLQLSSTVPSSVEMIDQGNRRYDTSLPMSFRQHEKNLVRLD